MAWKPWYDRMAEMDTAEERTNFIKGVFGPPPLSERKMAGLALNAILAGWGTRTLLKATKKK